MKAEREINNKILDKILEIQESYPELYLFLDEMTVYRNVSALQKEDSPHARLQNYYDSLNEMLNSYILNTKGHNG